jgi:hypothetical protein
MLVLDIQLQYAPHLSSTPHKVSALSWRIIRTPSRRDDSRGHIREPQYLFPKEHTLERSRFRSGPRQTAPNVLELPNQVTPPSVTFGPRKYCTQLQTFHLTLSMLMINIRDTDIQAIIRR